jgi:hypothetical protein
LLAKEVSAGQSRQLLLDPIRTDLRNPHFASYNDIHANPRIPLTDDSLICVPISTVEDTYDFIKFPSAQILEYGDFFQYIEDIRLFFVTPAKDIAPEWIRRHSLNSR